MNQQKLKCSPRTIFSVFNTDIVLIIDSGASCSIIDCRFLPNNVKFRTDDIISIKGINGVTKSLGSIDTILRFGNDNYDIKFNVVSNLPSNIAGLIGTDFLVHYRANIDFEALTLSLRYRNDKHIIPLTLNGTVAITIPARTEITTYVKTQHVNTCVVLNQEVTSHVYISNSIGQPSNGLIPVRIVNFKNKPVVIDHIAPHIEPASNYNIIELSKNDNNIDKNRASKLLRELKLGHLSGIEEKTIKQICLKYADIFCLEGDKLGTTNVIARRYLSNPIVNPP